MISFYSLVQILFHFIHLCDYLPFCSCQICIENFYFSLSIYLFLLLLLCNYLTKPEYETILLNFYRGNPVLQFSTVWFSYSAISLLSKHYHSPHCCCHLHLFICVISLFLHFTSIINRFDVQIHELLIVNLHNHSAFLMKIPY